MKPQLNCHQMIFLNVSMEIIFWIILTMEYVMMYSIHQNVFLMVEIVVMEILMIIPHVWRAFVLKKLTLLVIKFSAKIATSSKILLNYSFIPFAGLFWILGLLGRRCLFSQTMNKYSKKPAIGKYERIIQRF